MKPAQTSRGAAHALGLACTTALAASLSGCDAEGRAPPAPPAAPEYRVIFEDDFDGDALDAAKWNVAVDDGCPHLCGGGATKRYAGQSVSVHNGALIIEPAPADAAPAVAGAVHTAGKFNFQYGRVEVAAKLPVAHGLAPSIRLLPADASKYGPLPSAGEIGIVEGFDAGAVRGITRYGLPVPPFHGAAATYGLGRAPDAGFVEYAVEWDWDTLRFFQDSVHVHTQSSAEWYAYYPADANQRHDPLAPYRLAGGSPPFDQPFHLAIELATDGQETGVRPRLEIESVRVFECAGAAQGGVGCGRMDSTVEPLRDGAGGPLAERETAKPHRQRLDLYAGGPATLSAPVADAPVAAALIDGTWATGAMVESELNAADAQDPARTVWRVAVSGGAGEAFLAAQNLSQEPAKQTGFDFSGNRRPGPGGEPVGEVAFDLKVQELAANARIAVGMDAGYPHGPRFELPRQRLSRDEWRTHSVKFADLVGDDTHYGMQLRHITRPFVLRAEGDAVNVLIDNIRVVNACKVVGGCGAAPAEVAARRRACVTDGRPLNVGFYAFFEPVSASANPDPTAPGFNAHRGYEADLLTALAAMRDGGLAFTRRAIPTWPGIWLRSATPDHDIVGGGITILDSRTRNAAGETVVAFTEGHIAFRQSLLVRTEDAGRFPNHAALTDTDRVGVLAGTTGEFRLLQLTGLVDDAGALAAGTRVTTTRGVVVADGSAAYRIHPAGASANLDGRQRLQPPAATMPQVIYLGDELGEAELLAALGDGRIDAVARGEIGNSDAAAVSDGRFRVTALDPQAEYGGFTVAVENTDLLACLNDRIRWLTDGGQLGYPHWRDDNAVFQRRAELWNDAE